MSGGAKAAQTAFAAQTAITGGAIANSLIFQSGPGFVTGVLGAQGSLVGKSAESLAVNLGRSLPVIGLAINAFSLGYDAVQTAEAFTSCRSGH